MNLHNNLGPNKQNAHGNWDLREEQTFLNSSDAFSARLRATAANRSDEAAKLKLVLLLRGKLAPTLLHTKFTPKSHKSKSNFKPDGKGWKGEWRNPRILNSSKQAFPRPPETEQQRMRGYPDISDVLPFKLFLVVKTQALHEEIYPLAHSPLLYTLCAIVTLMTYDHKIHKLDTATWTRIFFNDSGCGRSIILRKIPHCTRPTVS